VHVLRAIGKDAKLEDMRGYFEHLSLLDPLIVAKMVKGMHDHDASDVLAQVTVPTLILHGTADPFTPIEIARVMDENISNSTLIVYDGGAHTLPIERPDEINDDVLRFLTSF
jgi:pimeloyl-ACP methyl ester carboxylesterase